MTVYRHISGEKAHGALTSRMCELLGVSASGYYAWASPAPSDRALGDAWLIERIKAIRAANRGVLPVRPRLGAARRARAGRRMRQAGLSKLVSRKRGRTTIRVRACGSPTTSCSAGFARRHLTRRGHRHRQRRL